MKPHHRYRLQWLLLGLLLFSFAIRLHALLQLPAFVDEGNHLRWAAEIWQAQVVFPFSTAKGLTLYYLAALLPFHNPLWPGRAAVVLSGVVTLSGLWALARSWGNPRLGLWAAALYALMPWTFFHERLAISDPLAAASAVLLAWAATEWARCSEPRCWRRSVGLALLLFVTPLFKLSTAPLLVIPLLVVVLRKARGASWWTTFRPMWPPYGLSGLALAVTLGVASRRYQVTGELIDRADLTASTWLQQTYGNLQDLVVWGAPYLGILGWLVLSGALLALWRRSELALLALAGCLLAGGIFVLTAGGAFPRYYVVALAFGAFLGAYAIEQLYGFIRSDWLRWSIIVGLIVWLGGSFGRFAMQAYRDPAQLDLASEDRRQHVTAWSSGYGIQPATTYIVQQIENDPEPAVVYGQDLATWSIMRLYWPETANGQPYELWEATAPPVIDTVAAGTPTYLLVDTARDAANFEGLTINPHEIARLARPLGGAPVVVYRLVPEPFQFPEP